MIIETEISWGYLSLFEIFAQANNLDLRFENRPNGIYDGYITILYEDNSDTDISITCLSIKHLGFQNMLYDYLIKCGIDVHMIPVGRYVMKKAMNRWKKNGKNIDEN